MENNANWGWLGLLGLIGLFGLAGGNRRTETKSVRYSEPDRTTTYNR
ncbi:MAG: WGxxGxxG-CTERM domain-containing protein [Elainellaceae cyanobacterium]